MMPQASGKAQKSAGSTSLAGCTITFADKRTSIVSSQHPDLATKQFVDIQNEITDRGGTYTTKVSEATHLVTTSQQYAKNLQKIKEAVDNGRIEIVDIEWLVKSFSSDTKVDESKYSLHMGSNKSDSSLNDQTPKTATTVKKEQDDDAEDSESKANVKPLSTRTKSTSKNLKRSRDDSSDDGQDIPKKTKTTDKKPKAETDEKAASTVRTGKIRVPVDDGFRGQKDDHEVFINDKDGIAWDAALNQTNAGNNNNKFYRIQVLKNIKTGRHYCWTRWGRVGESGQCKLIDAGDVADAEREFKKKFKEKNGNAWEMREQPAKSGKYTFIELNYEESDDEDEAANNKNGRRSSNASSNQVSTTEDFINSTLAEPVQRLMQFIFNTEFINNTLADMNYDAAKMPLGKLSKKTLLRGYEVLKEMAAIVGSSAQVAVSSNRAQLLQDLSNQYFSLIPHDFGRNRPPTINDISMIQKEITVLENLTDMQLANEIMKHAKNDKKDVERMSILDRQYQGLGMQEMTPLGRKSTEYKELEDYLHKTSAAGHKFQHNVQDIFRIERTGEQDRFEQSEYSKIPDSGSDRRLLWHGSRATNYGGILSQGLRIAPPEAPVSGYMFGKGVYLADMSSKSANYCCSSNSANTGLLLLCEVELGKPSLQLTNADYNAGERAKAQKSISTLGMGGEAPPKWKDASCVHKSLKGVSMPDVKHEPCKTKDKGTGLGYNEYIVYDVAQIKLRYLLRVEMKHSR